MNIKNVTLGNLAVAGFLFNSLTPYNNSLVNFRLATDDKIDLNIQEHRDALINWLNDWGCRHLSKAYHHIASQSILDWYQTNYASLFSEKMPLWQLEDKEIETVVNAYGSLKDKTGALRVRGGSEQEVHIGPTAASKILFAIRPKALMPWDEAMRISFECDGSPESYSKYLIKIRDLTLHIEHLCRGKGFPIDALLQKLGRSNSTVLVLVNEYIWVTETRKVVLPSSETLLRWASLE
jgi:hypothetical protein